MTRFHGSQILVVDDVPLNLKLLVELLTREGYIVRPVTSGAMALRAVETEPPDLILMDVNMPEMNGYEVCEHLKVDPRFRQIPVIFVSVADDTSHKVRAFESGGVDYITKPFQIHEVKARIETHLELYHQQQELQRQKMEIEILRDTVALINSTLHLNEVLDRILINVGKVVKHDRVNLMLIDNDHTRVVGHQGYPPEYVDLMSATRFNLHENISLNTMLASRQSLIVNDISRFEGWDYSRSTPDIRSYLGAPIIQNNEVIGFINLDSVHLDFFQPDDAERLKAFADQIAIAIANASAFEEATELAAAQERQRLARDLHDAVSQTLFSASMIAETLPMFIETQPGELRNGLAELVRLTQGAQAEMRTLLIELRPRALIETDLSILFTHLITGFRARITAEVQAKLDLCHDITLPVDVKINLYRIMQESLNNILKHACATLITISLQCNRSGVNLVIQDNGVGFELEQVAAGRMGTRIMRERALSTDISLKISSEHHQGTKIEASWKTRL